MTEFTPDMHHKLGHYVYRLIDPRDGSTFYVGRGQVNRVFEHINVNNPALELYNSFKI